METNKPEKTREQQAQENLKRGRESASKGDFSTAKDFFRRSMELVATAESCTYYAWMLSFDGDFDGAIALCKKAIELDPEFGNPYNDIGAYYIAKGQIDDAIGWLERAKGAPRYDAKHFPYTNLGRVYLQKGWLRKAKQEFDLALKLLPESEEIPRILSAIERGLN